MLSYGSRIGGPAAIARAFPGLRPGPIRLLSTSGAQSTDGAALKLLKDCAKIFVIAGGISFGVTSSFKFGPDVFKHFRSLPAYGWLGDNVALPLMRLLDPETAHEVAVASVKHGLGAVDDEPDPPILKTTVLGLEFPNPIGLAAGFDKHAEAVDGLLDMGFGFVEVGSVTPEPQEGNPKPRMFRLPEDLGVINRCGFNSHGVSKVEEQLAARQKNRRHFLFVNFFNGRSGLLGVNVGKNKSTEDAAADYCIGIRRLGPFADYIVVNISSPNTPGLRALQRRDAMAGVIKAAAAARDDVLAARRAAAAAAAAAGESSDAGKDSATAERPLPLLVKIAPDLDEQERRDVAAVALNSAADGLIVSNTTIARPAHLKGAARAETGGLSGKPLKDAATQCVSDMYRLTGGKVPIIGVGGVGTAEDAYEKILAGASLVQVYSAMVYSGPGKIPGMKQDLARLLEKDGFKSVTEAVGAAHRGGRAA